MRKIKTVREIRAMLQDVEKISKKLYEYQDLFCGFGGIVSKKVVDEGWNTFYEEVYKLELVDDIIFVCIKYQACFTEYQDNNVTIYEVEPYEVVTTRYKRVE